MCPSQKFVKQFVAYVCIFSKLMNINTAVIGRNSGAKHKYRSNSGKSLLFYLPYWLLFCLQFLSRITSTLGHAALFTKCMGQDLFNKFILFCNDFSV